jgi:hypothetical protein
MEIRLAFENEPFLVAFNPFWGDMPPEQKMRKNVEKQSTF